MQQHCSQAELEEEEAHLAAELAASFVPYAEEATAEEAVSSWKLARVPDALTKELDAYLVSLAHPLKAPPRAHLPRVPPNPLHGAALARHIAPSLSTEVVTVRAASM